MQRFGSREGGKPTTKTLQLDRLLFLLLLKVSVVEAGQCRCKWSCRFIVVVYVFEGECGGSSLVPEERVVFALNSTASSQLTLAKIRRVYTRLDNRSIAKQVFSKRNDPFLPLTVIVWIVIRFGTASLVKHIRFVCSLLVV